MFLPFKPDTTPAISRRGERSVLFFKHPVPDGIIRAIGAADILKLKQFQKMPTCRQVLEHGAGKQLDGREAGLRIAGQNGQDKNALVG